MFCIYGTVEVIPHSVEMICQKNNFSFYKLDFVKNTAFYEQPKN